MADTPNGGAAGGNDTILSTTVKWGENTVQLKDFTKPTPNLIKVTKGQYRNIGVAKSVHSELYIHSIRTTKKVLAEGVKVKDAKRLLQTDQRFSMPVTYQGWFELLSEDGKAIKALQTVAELARLFPQSCLVRETIKGFVPRENGELALDKVRTIHAGEMLTLAGEINIPVAPNSKQGAAAAKRRLLKCFDAKGDSVYLSFDQKGMFSPVAGQANISGVHNIKGLIAKFRFPILVRLVHGIIPTKVEKTFTGVFRLTGVFSDETAFVCPLKKDAKMVPISTREPLKVSVATNFNKLQDLDDSKFFHQKCTQMMASYMNSIHVLVAMPDPSLLAAGKAGPELNPAVNRKPSKEVSSPNHKVAPNNSEEEDQLFEEIEAIYDYVRSGGPPPDLRRKPPAEKAKSQQSATAVAVANSANPKKPVAAVVPVSQGDNVSKGDRDSAENITWTEPIYEPLDKIREQKKKVQEIEQTMEFGGNYEIDGEEIPDNEVEDLRQSTVPISQDEPLLSLRQVLKSQHDVPHESDVQKRPRSFAGFLNDEDIKRPLNTQPVVLAGANDAPPVPPRKYSEGVAKTPTPLHYAHQGRNSLPSDSLHSTSPSSDAIHVSMHSSVGAMGPPVPAPMGPRGPRGPVDKKRLAPPPPPAGPQTPSMAASSQTSMLNANHLVYKPSQIKPSPVRPTQLLPANGPQARGTPRIVPRVGTSPTSPNYVAVAKVGDVVHRPNVVTSPVYPTNTALETHTLGRPGAARQSMYL